MTGLTEANRAAWNEDRYEAWVTAYGTPEAAAAALRADPRRPLRRLLPHLGEPAGRRVLSVQGSHGRVATALALLAPRPPWWTSPRRTAATPWSWPGRRA